MNSRLTTIETICKRALSEIARQKQLERILNGIDAEFVQAQEKETEARIAAILINLDIPTLREPSY